MIPVLVTLSIFFKTAFAFAWDQGVPCQNGKNEIVNIIDTSSECFVDPKNSERAICRLNFYTIITQLSFDPGNTPIKERIRSYYSKNPCTSHSHKKDTDFFTKPAKVSR